LLVSALPGAAYLGRKMLDQVGVNKHPALRVTYGISLLSGTGGTADFTLGNRVLKDVLRTNTLPTNSKVLPPPLLATARDWGAEKTWTSSLPRLNTR
jgi:hypothetical protein